MFFFFPVSANGEFTILSTPKSLTFKGTEPLQSQYVGDFIYAALGNAVAGAARWSGLTINDPFNMPSKVVAIALSGAENSKLSATGKTFDIEGSSVEPALNGVSAQLEADNDPVCDINFENFADGIESFNSVLGDVKVTPIVNTKYLSSELHSCDKQYLQSIARMRALGDNFGNLAKTCSLVVVRLSVECVTKAHGEKSEAMSEAMELFTSASKALSNAAQKSSNNEALVFAVVNKVDNLRAKREALTPDAKVSIGNKKYSFDNQQFCHLENLLVKVIWLYYCNS